MVNILFSLSFSPPSSQSWCSCLGWWIERPVEMSLLYSKPHKPYSVLKVQTQGYWIITVLMKSVKDNDAILFRTFYFLFPWLKSKYITLQIRDSKICWYPSDCHTLFPKEHIPLTPEVRLGIWAPGSETPTLLVSPIAGLTAQVSCVCSRRTRPCLHGAPVMGRMWQRGWLSGCLLEELVPPGVWVTWRWGPHSHLGEGIWGRGS